LSRALPKKRKPRNPRIAKSNVYCVIKRSDAKHHVFDTNPGIQQESRAAARKPRDAAVVLFGLKFADRFKSNQTSKAS